MMAYHKKYLLLEGCRCGLNIKKPQMGCTKTYCSFGALIERPQMRPYHNKLLVVVGFIFKNSERSVELLGEDGTHNLVREGHLRK